MIFITQTFWRIRPARASMALYGRDSHTVRGAAEYILPGLTVGVGLVIARAKPPVQQTMRASRRVGV